jgi:hypothetical protein
MVPEIGLWVGRRFSVLVWVLGPTGARAALSERDQHFIAAAGVARYSRARVEVHRSRFSANAFDTALGADDAVPRAVALLISGWFRHPATVSRAE